MALQTTPTG